MVRIRFAASLLALGAGVVAVVVAILLVHSTVG
jgi:hypothetical protein